MAMEVNIISIISILIMFSILISIGISIMLDKNVIAMPCIIGYEQPPSSSYSASSDLFSAFSIQHQQNHEEVDFHHHHLYHPPPHHHRHHRHYHRHLQRHHDHHHEQLIGWQPRGRRLRGKAEVRGAEAAQHAG